MSELFASLSEELPELSNTNLKALFLAYERKKGHRDGGGEWEGKRLVREGGGGERTDGEEGEAEKEEDRVEEKEVEEEEKEELGKEEEEKLEGEVGKERESFWQPYLDSLPATLHTTLFFTEEDLQHLQTSMVHTPPPPPSPTSPPPHLPHLPPPPSTTSYEMYHDFTMFTTRSESLPRSNKRRPRGYVQIRGLN